MGRRYQCDYCNRSFSDTPSARKKHINSIHHQRMKKMHYDSFKDHATLLAEEAQKTPCKRFFQTGQCDFGDHCKFSHLNQASISASLSAAYNKDDKSDCERCDVNVWVANWKSRNASSSAKVPHASPKFKLPAGFPPLHQLPPSLQPPPDGFLMQPQEAEWG